MHLAVAVQTRVGLWWLPIMFGSLYATQGLVGGLVQTALPTALRDAGMALDRLGILYLVFIPWALKFLWAPWVDRPLPLPFGRRRGWLLLCQAMVAAAFALLAALPPDSWFAGMVAVVLLITVVSATQDIATDACAVEVAEPQHRALVSGAGVCGGYTGFLVGVGIWLPVYAAAGWAAAMLVLSAAVIVLTVPTWLLHRIERPPREAAPPPSLGAAWGRPETRTGVAFLVIYQSGLRLGIALIGPFLIDSGLALTAVGWFKGAGGAAAGLAGAVAGALLARRLSLRTALTIAALLNAAAFSALAIAGAGGASHGLLGALVLLQAAAAAASFVVLYSAMMGWCSPGQLTTEFALFQCADAVLAILLAVAAGFIGKAFGMATVFALASALLVGAAVATNLRPVSGPLRLVPSPGGAATKPGLSQSLDRNR